jgi:hypothetical protein
VARRASVLALFALLAACAPNPNGQGVTDTNTIVGTVVDAAHPTQPVNTATIQIGVQVTRLSPSDQGQFTLNNVPTGTQTLQISSPGFNTYSAPVVVRKGDPINVGVIGLQSTTGL